MLAGVWLSGGFFMMIAWLAGGTAYRLADFVTGVVLLSIPPLTFIGSAYDGSLLALLLVNLGYLLTWAAINSGMPLPFHRLTSKSGFMQSSDDVESRK